MHRPSINNPNVSLIQVSWLAPERPEGQVNLYELSIKEKTPSENTSHVINTTALSYTLPSCDKDDKIYYFSVRAINIEGSDRYPGPWSEETENYCQPAPKYIYYLGMMLVVVMAGVTLYCVRRLCTQCKRMQDIEIKLPGNLEPQCDLSLGLSQWQPVVDKQRPGDEHATVGRGHGHSHGRDHHHHHAPDEQLLLDGKVEGCRGTEVGVGARTDTAVAAASGGGGGDSSGCSSGQESVISSLASATNLSATGTDSGTEQPRTPADEEVEMELEGPTVGSGSSTGSGSVNSSGSVNGSGSAGASEHSVDRSREGSLRLRKPVLQQPGYCVLGVQPETGSGAAEQKGLVSRGYVPLPKLATMATPLSASVTPSSPYVIAIDSKQLVKKTPAGTAVAATAAPYSSVVPTTTLININDPGALSFALQPTQDPATTLKHDRNQQHDSLHSFGLDYQLNPYCRLGLDAKAVSPHSNTLAHPAHVYVADQRPTPSHQIARGRANPLNGYVPHKHLDSKMLKGD